MHRYTNEKRRKLHLASGTILNSRLADSSAHLLVHGPFLTVGPVPSTIRRIVARVQLKTEIAENSLFCSFSIVASRDIRTIIVVIVRSKRTFSRRNRRVVNEGSTSSSFADALEFNTDWAGHRASGLPTERIVSGQESNETANFCK